MANLPLPDFISFMSSGDWGEEDFAMAHQINASNFPKMYSNNFDF